MAKNNGSWSLELKGNDAFDLCGCDKEHIASLIKEGFTSGEIVKCDACKEVKGNE